MKTKKKKQKKILRDVPLLKKEPLTEVKRNIKKCQSISDSGPAITKGHICNTWSFTIPVSCLTTTHYCTFLYLLISPFLWSTSMYEFTAQYHTQIFPLLTIWTRIQVFQLLMQLFNIENILNSTCKTLSVTLSLFPSFMGCAVIALLLLFSLDTRAKVTKA